jgi:hypothetical protein
MRTVKYMYPRYYFKKVGGSISIEHRLTHSMLMSVTDESQLIDRLTMLNDMSEEDLWEWLLLEKRVRIPNQRQGLLSKAVNPHEHEEEWFINAWSIFTDLFYMQNPDLLVEEKELPMNVISKVRKKQYAEEKAADEKRRKEIENAERLAKLDEQSVKRQVKKDKKKEVEAEGKFGIVASLERLKNKKKVKKLKIVTKAKKVIDFIDDDDPFA